MTQINDYENWATKMANYNSLDISNDQLDRIRNLDTPESEKLDVLIDLMADMQQSIEETNQKLDVHHAEQIEYQKKSEMSSATESRKSLWNTIFAATAALGVVIPFIYWLINYFSNM